MRDRIEELWERLRSSYWFIPALMVIAAILLSIVMIRVDQGIETDIAWIGNIVYVDSAEGARQMLSTISSSMITVAGVVFSITMVVLSLTSQQFGPLVLIHFRRDRSNQLVLGTFVATFVYCLLVLRTISGSESAGFVPRASVLVGIGMGLASLGVLIYFIHHVIRSIQPSFILGNLSQNLHSELESLFPEDMGQSLPHLSSESLELDKLEEKNLHKMDVTAPHGGYIRTIHENQLLKKAIDHDCIVQLKHNLGYFIVEEEPLITVWHNKNEDLEQLQKDFRSAFVIGISRTQNQDVAFMFVQLVEIALRALSPSLNDPFTAMMSVDRLKEALILLAKHEKPSPYRFDEEHNLRVIAPVLTFAEMVTLSYAQIIDYGRTDRNVLNHMQAVLDHLSNYAQTPEDKQALEQLYTVLNREKATFNENK